MAFGIKWVSEFHSYDRTGQESDLYKVEILDTTSAIDSEIDFKVQSLTMAGTPDESDHRCTIINTKCNVSMIVQTSGVEDFIENLGTSDEGRYWLRVYRNAGIFFVGAITTSGAYIEDLDFPYVFKFTAVDALTRLKNDDFDAASVQTTYGASALNYINAIFDSTGLDEFFSTEPFIEFYGGWRSDSAVNQTDNPFDHYGWYRTAFDKLDGDEVKPSKTIDVLKLLLTAMHSRIYWNNGTYIVEQWPYRAENTTLTRFKYDVSFTLISKDTGVVYLNTTFDGVTLDRLRGGRQSFLPPLKYVEVEYEHDPVDDYYVRDDNYTVGATLTTDDVTILNNDQKLKVEFETQINNLNWDQTGVGRKRPIIRLTVKLGTKYLKKVQTGGSIASPTFSALTWETSLSYFEYCPLLLDRHKDLVEGYSFVTEELVNDFTLNSQYTLEVSFISLQYLDENMDRQSILGEYTLSNNKLMVYPTDANSTVNEKTKTIYRATGSSANTQSYQIKMPIGEGPKDTSSTGVRVKAPIWTPNVEDWGDNDENLLQLLANSHIAFRKLPCRKLTNWTWLKSYWTPGLVIDFDSRLWAVLQYSYDVNSEEIKGSWIEIDYDDTGLTKEKEEYISLGDPYTPGGGGGGTTTDPDTPAGTSLDLDPTHYHEEFSGVTDTYVTLTETGYLLNPATVSADLIRRRIDVYASGVKQGYDKAFGYDIDHANNRIRFKARSGTGYRNLLNEDVVVDIKPY